MTIYFEDNKSYSCRCNCNEWSIEASKPPWNDL